MNTRTLTLVAAAAVSLLAACKSGPAAPFDRLKDSPITVYRLQNYEPPAAAAATVQPGTAPGVPMIPGLPPEIQSWVSQGAQGMGSLIPPGLLPPGLIPGTAPATTTTTPAPADAARFEGFRILGQAQVMDPKTKEDLVNLFGTESNFDNTMAQCLYPEVGVSFQQTPPMLPDDVLVSFSCDHVDAKNFQWPFTNKGLTQDTVKKFSEINKKLFGG